MTGDKKTTDDNVKENTIDDNVKENTIDDSVGITEQYIIDSSANIGGLKQSVHPTMTKFVSGEQNGNAIIDPKKIIEEITKVCTVIHSYAKSGKNIWIIGSGINTHATISDQCDKYNIPFMSSVYRPGIISNKRTTELLIRRMKRNDNTIKRRTREGLKGLTSSVDSYGSYILPDAVVAFDPDSALIEELNNNGIECYSIIDTDKDASLIKKGSVIPFNMENFASAKMLCELLIEQIRTGKVKHSEISSKSRSSDFFSRNNNRRNRSIKQRY